ncbi:MAG TPA: S41 family peptidase [Candidatus Deferrimicrobium sp.]|nr:S41 family peptidase [Candidatus Deferrimicrobium sp.]
MKRVNTCNSGCSPWQPIRFRRWTLFPALIMVLTLTSSATGQQLPDKPVTPVTQAEIIDSVCNTLNNIYVFPAVARDMEKHIRKLYKNRRYASMTSLRDFADTLTEDLRSICRDRHLGVRFVSDEMIAQISQDTLTDEGRKKQQEELEKINYGFKELRILSGNVGYLKLQQFAEAAEAGATAIAAMNFLAHADAVIIDLRENGGGNPSMIQLITSYFMREPTHLNTFYIRQTDSINQFWTQAWVPGPRMTDTKLYVLTSNFTFSGAEEFTYNLKNLKRATIVGETTGGGAHPVDRHLYANLNAGIQIPFGRAINPISGTNWEGTGVEPDIQVPQTKAFDAAYAQALQDLLKEESDTDRKRTLEWTADGLKAKLDAPVLSQEQLQLYAGSFGPRKIVLEAGSLFYQREGRPKYKMISMGNDAFAIDELDYFRLKFEKDQAGQYNKLVGMYDDGRTDSNARD